MAILKRSTVCGLFVNPKTHAAAQGIPEQGSLFGRYVYLNTQPKSFLEISGATILHESFHNMGIDDNNLAALLEASIAGSSVGSTIKLLEKSCAQK